MQKEQQLHQEIEELKKENMLTNQKLQMEKQTNDRNQALGQELQRAQSEIQQVAHREEGTKHTIQQLQSDNDVMRNQIQQANNYIQSQDQNLKQAQ